MAKKKPLKPRPELGESRRIIGIDPSLSSTGVAVLDLSVGTPSWRVGSVRTTPHDQTSLAELFGRLDRIVEGVEGIVGGWLDGDLVVIEGYMLATSGSRGPIIANWHRIAGAVVAAGIEPVVIAPSTRQAYAVGGASKETSSKDRVIIQAMKRFPEADVASNDEADAVFLAALGSQLAGCSVEPSPLPGTHLTFERHFEPRHAD